MGKPRENHGKMGIYMERSTIFSWEKQLMSMAIFNSYVTNYPVKLPEGTMGKTMS